MSANVIANEDACVWLRDLADGAVDLIITDPPYWTLEKWRKTGTTTRLGGHRLAGKRDESRWFATIDSDQLHDCIEESRRLLPESGHAYYFCDGQTLPTLLAFALDFFDYAKPLVWDKVNSGMGYHYRCTHEYVVMLEKGRRKLATNPPDILRFKMLKGRKYYPTQKPVDLIRLLIGESSSQSERVCDPFVGSGTVALCAQDMNRHYWVNDISETAIDVTKARLAGPCLDELPQAARSAMNPTVEAEIKARVTGGASGTPILFGRDGE